MPRTFNKVINENLNKDKVNRSAIRALQGWQYLISKARNRQLVRYNELAGIMGYKKNRPLNPILGHIMYYCIQEALPPLTIIIVNNDGTPGKGFTQVARAEFDRQRERTFAFDWFSIYPPSPEQFTAAWDAAHTHH
ncbi:MAG: hypothetical protein NTX52_06820 [Planctomycetota bacterium]|nr:hypothetical protein [Planctomycetota bacterium]